MARINTEQAFKDEVLQSSTPVLVHFWAPWCGLCRMIDPILERARAELGDNFKLVGVNADENLNLASSYRITNLPTVLLFQEGKLVHRVEDFKRKEQVRDVLDRVLSSVVR
jgi:thioredoxin 1